MLHDNPLPFVGSNLHWVKDFFYGLAEYVSRNGGGYEKTNNSSMDDCIDIGCLWFELWEFGYAKGGSRHGGGPD